MGVGFLAGVHTHVFPFAECFPLERTGSCTVTFNLRSATLVGVVTNGCTGEFMANTRARLLGPPNNGTRFELSDASGVFRFQGIEPGVAHSLSLTQPLAPADFLPLEMELIFGEAAEDTVHIEMVHARNCLA